nr:DNA polymerase subunit gamma-2, mitochondrial-like [Lytechinus pictus]
MSSRDVLGRVISLSSRHGYVYSSGQLRPTIGIKGCFDYGPLGVELRRNLVNEWWSEMVSSQEHVVGVENSVLQGSRATQISPSPGHSGTTSHHLNVRFHDDEEEAWLQSSLHDGLFSHYFNTLCLLNRRLPFGLAQVGPCFNRPSASQGIDTFIFNGLQTSEMSMQFFSTPKTSNLWFNTWHRDRLSWWRKFAGIPSDFTATDITTSEHVQSAEIQYKFPWGVDTIERISNHGSVPVEQMQDLFKTDMQGKDGRKSVIPHTIETSASLEGGLLSYLVDGYQEKQRTDTRGQSVSREILRLHLRLAPLKVIILPLRGTKELRELSDYLGKEFRKASINVRSIIEVSPSLENYYTMFDEMGVPFTILLNENTLKSGILRVRNRDTTLMQQLHITEVRDMILRHLEAD